MSPTVVVVTSTVLAETSDNFRYARRSVGQQLLALVKQDMLGRPSAVAVREGAERKVVHFNRPILTDDGPAVENDLTVARVKVVLEDIPATPSFRAQHRLSDFEVIASEPARLADSARSYRPHRRRIRQFCIPHA